MESYKLVLHAHLNHYGYLYGGHLLKWVDEAGWIAASQDYPGCNFVTVGLDRVEFKKSVKEGSILRFKATKTKEGNTSVQYHVEVFGANIKSGDRSPIFSTNITFVCLDEDGSKRSLTAKGNEEYR